MQLLMVAIFSLGAGLLLGPTALRLVAGLRLRRAAIPLQVVKWLLFVALALTGTGALWFAYGPNHAFLIASVVVLACVWSLTSGMLELRSAALFMPHVVAAILVLAVAGTEAVLADYAAGGPASCGPEVCEAIGGTHAEGSLLAAATHRDAEARFSYVSDRHHPHFAGGKAPGFHSGPHRYPIPDEPLDSHSM